MSFNYAKKMAESKEEKLVDQIFFSNSVSSVKSFAMLIMKNRDKFPKWSLSYPESNENFLRCEYEGIKFVLTLGKDKSLVICRVKSLFDENNPDTGFSDIVIGEFDLCYSVEMFEYNCDRIFEKILHDDYMCGWVEKHNFQKNKIIK